MSKLFLVPTPIGNLKDITFRALEILGSVDLILAEDTRQTKKLLNHFNISTPLQSHHMFNEHKSSESICAKILSGIPLHLFQMQVLRESPIRDFCWSEHALKRRFLLKPFPEPTALIPALVNSGLPCDRFCFEGFLPPKKGRNKRITALAEETRTMVFYESPYRLIKTLDELALHFGPERMACVSRELSKMFEENIRGTLTFLSEYYTDKPPKGEIVITVAGKKD